MTGPVCTTSVESKIERAIGQARKEMESGALEPVRCQTALDLLVMANGLVARARQKQVEVGEEPINAVQIG